MLQLCQGFMGVIKYSLSESVPSRRGKPSSYLIGSSEAYFDAFIRV